MISDSQKMEREKSDTVKIKRDGVAKKTIKAL
jgi:hypothetical protein